MVAVMEKEEDLIIGINQEPSNDFINFDFGDNSVASEDIIDFGGDTKIDKKEDIINLEEVKNDLNTSDFVFDLGASVNNSTSNETLQEVSEPVISDLSFDLGSLKEEINLEVPEKKEEIQLETNEIQINNDLDFLKQEVKEDVKVELVDKTQDDIFSNDSFVVPVVSNSEVLGDRNDILNITISNLEKRKNQVINLKAGKESYLADLNKQIADLKSRVAECKDEIANLELEETGINEDIVSIENMKNNNSKTSTRKRVHNTDNIKK